MASKDISRKAFLAGAGTVLASLTVPLASAPAPALAEEASLISTAGGSEKIVVIGTNDVHGTLKNPKTALGYAALADYASAQREEYGEGLVTLVDSGDVMQGNIAVDLSGGSYLAQAVAAAGYNVIAPGNHDFDHGIDALNEYVAAEGVACTCCNFTDANGNCVLAPYHVIEYPAGSETVRVAYVGVTTPSARGKSAKFKDDAGNFIYDFAVDDTGEKLVFAVQAAVDDARSAGAADYVVLLAHLGQSWSAVNWRSDTVIGKTNGIDAVLDAHTHQLYVQAVKNKDGQEVPVVQAGCKFMAFSRLEIDPSAKTVSASAVATGVAAELVSSWDTEDADVAALVDSINAQIDEQTGEEVGTSEVELHGFAEDGSALAWLGETNLGDLVADAMLAAAKQAGVECDMALCASFDVCADIAKGTVVERDVYEALPFSRKICALEVSGQHLLDILEVGCALLPEPEARLIQVSDGFTYQINTGIESPVTVSDADCSYVGIEGERRVTAAQLNGKDIDPAASYTIAMQKSMLLNGAWSMPVPDSAGEAVEVATDGECLISYIKDSLAGTIGEKYAEAAGRITITNGETTGAAASSDGSGIPVAAIPAVAVGVAAAAAGIYSAKGPEKKASRHE